MLLTPLLDTGAHMVFRTIAGRNELYKVMSKATNDRLQRGLC